MTLPKHIDEVSPERAAVAPYNFVPLPEQVVWAEPSFVKVRHDAYMPGRATGSITCILTTESPLYVRCATTAKQFTEWGGKRFWQLTPKQQEEYAQSFYTEKLTKPVIPGSSLRGMLRALVEIVGYSRMRREMQYARYSYRAMADDSIEPLKPFYKKHLKNVRAGFLIHTSQGWFIRPSREIKGGSYWRILEDNIPKHLDLIRFNESNYRLQYINVSFTDKVEKRRFCEVNLPEVYSYKGVLVTSGNMLETSKGEQFSANSRRKNHYIVPIPDDLFNSDGIINSTSQRDLPIDSQAIRDYCASLTDFQREQFDEHFGMLKQGRPVFYCQPEPEHAVIYFGQSPNFRIPYRSNALNRAVTLCDFVPLAPFDTGQADLAEAVFGYVREGIHCAGRVFVSDATICEEQEGVVYDHPITPRILASPKPTTFQHYLTQSSDQKSALYHYESGSEQTVLRGYKLYWHQGNVDLASVQENEIERIEKSPKQYTKIRPIKPQTRFKFTIRFENLSYVELGAILWVLRIADDDRFRLKLGMGKPLGLGSIKVSIDKFVISGSVSLGKIENERAKRYSKLFDQEMWALGERLVSEAEIDAYINKFTKYVLQHSGEGSKGCTNLADTLRIRCLLSLLTWYGTSDDSYQHHPAQANTHYLDQDEYKKRNVLPSPLQVMGVIPREGDEVTGYCRGLMSVDTLDTKVIIQGAAPHVVGILPGRFTSSQIKARVTRREEQQCGSIFLWLEPIT